MAEQLATLDGTPVDVDGTEAAFAAAMAAPPTDRPGMAAPARKPPEPVADPEQAPHGWTYTEGQWRPKKAPGRPRAGTGDKPRVSDAPAPAPPSSPAKQAPPGTDYRKPLREVAEALWLVMAIAPIPDQAFGFKLGPIRTRLRVQAALVEANTDQLAGGLNLIGQHNKFVGRALARLASGEGGLWALPAVMMLAPIAAQTGQLWSGRLADEATLQTMAAQTQQAAGEYLVRLAEAEIARAAAEVDRQTAPV